MSSLLDKLPLNQVLRTIPSGLFLVDKDMNIVYWNDEAERLTGFSAAETIGQPCSFLEGIPCGDGTCGLYDPSVHKPITGVRCSIKNRQGKRLTILKNVDLLRDEKGEVIGGIESFINITQIERLEKKLRRHSAELEIAVQTRTAELEQERTQLRTVLDTMTDLAYISSDDFNLSFMNRAMADLFGYIPDKPCFEIISERTTPCPDCPFARIKKGQIVIKEHTLPINGRVYEVIHSPLRSAQGKIDKLSVFRDITERKEQEQRLLEANREMDAFVSTVSHDLRTPLTPIIAYAEFLKDNYGDQLDEQAVDMLNEIETQSRKVMNQMEDLLVLARLGRLEKPLRPVDVQSVIQGILIELREMLDIENFTIQVTALPPIAIPATLLYQIFSNLISNALRYASVEEKPLEITGQSGAWGTLYQVRDHGPGIPAQEKSRIFDLFYRGNSAGTVPGSGIGLATVRKIVHLYGGRIGVDDTPGGGCTFWIEFPPL